MRRILDSWNSSSAPWAVFSAIFCISIFKLFYKDAFGDPILFGFAAYFLVVACFVFFGSRVRPSSSITQVYATAPHMLDINWAPIVGALVVTKKAWDDMSPAAQEALQSTGSKAGMQIRTKARQEVDEAVEAMKKRGLQVHKPTPEQLKEWNDLAEKLYPRIRGKMVPAETFDEVMALLKAYRAGKR